MSKIKDCIEFPVIYTFKIVGENTSTFTFGVEEIFCNYEEISIVPTFSKGEKYISLSTTVTVNDYEELEYLYGRIARLKGLRFQV